ncbi:MAG: DUF2341 domain-containing protein [Planctomycetales bacterium]|nr:DUF2341 domain-containing protein [Planctomycetales bacterium]
MFRRAKFVIEELLGAAKLMRSGSQMATARSLELCQLESRILMSASPVEAAPSQAECEPVTEECAEPTENQNNRQPVSDVVFIDGAVSDLETLLADLQAQQLAGRDLAVFVLDAGSDGVAQISQILDGLTDVGTIHVVSHAEQGSVKLGSVWLGADSVAGYAGAIADWQSALTSEADILFYGCNLASSNDGLTLLESIAELTGADVAASTDDTGNVRYGADWELEYAIGSIEASQAFSAQAQAEWSGKLATITVTTFADVVDGGDGLLSLREAIDLANSGSGGDTIILAAGTYTLSIGGAAEASNASGDLDIHNSLTIVGAGAFSTVIDASGLGDRVFEIHSGTVNVEGLTISGGSGVTGAGMLTKAGTNTQLLDVEVRDNNSVGHGGGIQAFGFIDLERVTLADNFATGSGGGIYFVSGSGGTLTNVTISGNTAANGGALFNDNNSVTITNSTLANNSTGIGTNGSHSTQLRNTILSNIGQNSDSALTSLGNNIDSDNSAALGDPLSGANPMLGALANYGGSTRTHSLLSGSAAIDAGLLAGAPTEDGRNAVRDSTPDIGAYEFLSNQIAAASSSITIDGTEDSQWSSVSSNSINHLIMGSVDNTSDLSGSWRSLWDANFLYVLVDVNDTNLKLDSANPSDDDSIELFIDPNYSHGTNYDGVDDYQLIFRLFDSVVHPGINSQTDTTGVDHASQTTAGGYVVEIAIPWTLLGVIPQGGTAIGIEVQINDDDDGGFRDGKVAWQGTDDSAASSPSAFAAIQLAASSIPNADAGTSYVVDEGGTITLDGTGSTDSDGSITLYEWDLNYDGTNFNPTANGSTTTFDASGISGSSTRTVALRVTDNSGNVSSLSTATVTINNVAPTITSPLTVSVQENSQFVQTVTASDPVDTVTYSITGGADGAAFEIGSTSGLLTFKASPDFEANADSNGDNVYEVQVTASDPSGAADVKTILVTLNDVPESPQAVDDDSLTLVDTPVVIDVLDNDIRGDLPNLTILDVGRASHGSVTDNGDGTVTYTPDSSYVGPDSFTYLITDGSEGLVHYWNLNGHADDVLDTADGSLVGGVDTVDGGIGFALSFDEVDDHVVIPDLTYSTSFTIAFAFRIDDSSGSQALTLYSHGDHSSANNLNISFGEDGSSFAGQLRTNLADANDVVDAAALDFDASGLVGDGLWHVYTLVVDAIDGAKVFLDGSLQAVDATRGGDAFDPNTNLFFGARHDLAADQYLGGAIDWVAILNHSNPLATSPPAAQVSVTVNEAPIADAGGPYTISEGSQTNLDGSGSTDANGTIAAYAWDLNYDGVNFNPTAFGESPIFDATALDDPQSRIIALRVTDNDGTESDLSLTTLHIVNADPQANDDTGVGFETTESGTFTTANVLANDSDVPGDTITLTSIDTSGTLGLVTNHGDGTFTYNPNGQFEWISIGQTATDTFTYTISDGEGGTDTATVTITLVGENDLPTVDPQQQFSVSELATNGQVVGNVIFHDIDATDTFTWTIVSGNDDGVFEIDSLGQLKVVDNSRLDFDSGTRQYSLAVSLSDGTTSTAVESIVVQVENKNDNSPTAVSEAFTIDEGATLTVSAAANWANANWDFRQKLTFDHSSISADAVNLPVLVRLHASALDAVQIDYSQLQANGEDLRFVDSDGTLLAYEIESWDSSGYSYVWVNVPQVNGGSNQDFIWMYYGNGNAPAGESPTSIWSSDLLAVLHMVGSATDSGQLSNDGVDNTTFTQDAFAGGAALFDGVDGNINLGSDASLDNLFAGGGAISTWIKPAGWGENGFGRIADKGSTAFNINGDGWALQVFGAGSSGGLRFEHGFSTTYGIWTTQLGSLNLNSWQQIVVQYDNSDVNNTPQIFINGVQQTVVVNQVPVGTVSSDAALDFKVGNQSVSSARTFDGLIDEFRVVSRLLTAQEVASLQLASSTSFIASAGVESGPGGLLNNDFDLDNNVLTVSLVSGPAHAASFTISADGSFSYVHDGSETTSDIFVYRVNDPAQSSLATVSLTINPVNDAPTGIIFNRLFLVENTDSSSGLKVGSLAAIDADLTDHFTYSISGGPDAAKFSIGGAALNELHLTDGILNFEVQSSYQIKVMVTDSGGAQFERPVTVFIADRNDLPQGLPVILGKPQFKETLLADTSHIHDDDGLGAFSFQWFRNGVAITGATGNSYTLVQDDVDARIRVSVSYTDARGTKEGPIFSAATTPIEMTAPPPAQPALTTLPPAPTPQPSAQPPSPTPVPQEASSVSDSADTIVQDSAPLAAPLAAPAAASPDASGAETEQDQRDEALPETLGAEPSSSDAGTLLRDLQPSSAGIERSASDTDSSYRVRDGQSLSNNDRYRENSTSFSFTSTDFNMMADSGELWLELDTLQENIQEDLSFEEVVMDSVRAVTGSLTVGYVIWMVRGGVVASTLIAQLPAWKYLDAMVVIANVQVADQDDDDSLESIVDQGVDEYKSVGEFLANTDANNSTNS